MKWVPLPESEFDLDFNNMKDKLKDYWSTVDHQGVNVRRHTFNDRSNFGTMTSWIRAHIDIETMPDENQYIKGVYRITIEKLK